MYVQWELTSPLGLKCREQVGCILGTYWPQLAGVFSVSVENVTLAAS